MEMLARVLLLGFVSLALLGAIMAHRRQARHDRHMRAINLLAGLAEQAHDQIGGTSHAWIGAALRVCRRPEQGALAIDRILQGKIRSDDPPVLQWQIGRILSEIKCGPPLSIRR